VPDYLNLVSFGEVFRGILGWDGLGYIFRVHGQEFNDRSSTVFNTSDCWNFSCGHRKSFSTPSVRSTFGNGSCGFWIRKA
jgi:hypothetical protein